MILELTGEIPRLDQYDLCILGSGPAGISIAQKFAGSSKQILLLEAGGMEYSEESTSLLECDSTGLEAWQQFSRQRFFGGTSNHWSGRCRPFEALDFRERNFASLPGWPIRHTEIERYLEEAKDILDIGEVPFAPANREPLDNAFVPDRWAMSPPTLFANKYRELLNSSENIHCYYNANAVELKLDKSLQKVDSVVTKNYLGHAYQFTALNFVVAMGGIENARFLLNQDKQIPSGIGNTTGMLGKCFMEHLNVKLGNFIMTDTTVDHDLQFYTSAELVSANDIASANVHLRTLGNIRSYGRTAGIKSFFKNLACDLGIDQKVQFISDFDCPGTGVISTLIEQRPGVQSYVKIGSEIDAIGLRKGVLNWELTDEDYTNIRFIARKLATTFADSGLGLVRLEDYILNDDAAIPIGRHAHHMGTTRMAASAKYGVVDKDCRVYGTDNLYIAGSSIFATGGAGNPTMPLIQFALRLVDHLKKIN